ncbi:MAG: dihydroorotate dehydrogenase [Candidatus Diapherotrites archaeon]
MGILETSFCSLQMQNPLILASGVLGVNKNNLLRAEHGGAGALTIKSISLEPREGHKNPITAVFECGMLNAVGYSNPGLKEALKEFADISDFKVPLIGSVTAGNAEEFASLAKEFEKLSFSALELPLSCPHTPGFGLLAGQGTPEATKAITEAVRKETKKPLIVKVSPSIPNIAEIALAAEKAGADAINCGNTLGPGMIIDINSGKPVLHFKVGGMSGPAIRPIIVRCVFDLYQAVKIPIIGLGGVMNGGDAIEMLQAGASAVGVGTAIHYEGSEVFGKISKEMEQWMKKHSYKSIEELVGIAHK